MVLRIAFIILCSIAALGCWSMTAKDRKAHAGSPEASTTPFAVTTPTPMPTTNTNSAQKDPDSPGVTGKFIDHLPKTLSVPKDDVSKLLLHEYGSIFVTKATPPTKIVFENEADVAAFQKSLPVETASIGGSTVRLQKPAMQSLQAAIADGKPLGINISPRGADSSARNYTQTVTLWASRVKPALAHWSAAGKISKADATRIASLSPYEQVPEVLKLESQGIWFAKDLSKSIIYSVAPPGTSQHLSMLALDVKQFDDANVRELLAKHGWFQTVTSDLPHFTYLGVSESELSGLGLKKVQQSGRDFWVPDI